MKQLLGQSKGKSRRLGQVGCEFLGLAHQFVVLDDIIDETERQSLVRLDKARREHQFLRLRHADPASQEPYRAAVRCEADAPENLREPRGFRGDYEVAGERNVGTICSNCFSIPAGTGANFNAQLNNGVGPTTPGSAATLSWAQLQTHPGDTNQIDPLQPGWELAGQERNSFVATFDQRLLPGVSFFFSGFYTNRRVVELTPQRDAARLRMAELLVAEHQPREAAPHFESLLQRQPANPCSLKVMISSIPISVQP